MFGFSSSSDTQTLLLRIQSWLASSANQPELCFYLTSVERALLVAIWQFYVSSAIDSTVVTLLKKVIVHYRNALTSGSSLELVSADVFSGLASLYKSKFNRVVTEVSGASVSAEVFLFLRRVATLTEVSQLEITFRPKLLCNPPILLWHTYRSLAQSAACEVSVLLHKVTSSPSDKTFSGLESKQELTNTVLLFHKIKQTYHSLCSKKSLKPKQALLDSFSTSDTLDKLPIYTLDQLDSIDEQFILDLYKLVLSIQVLFL